ncbi:MAG: hypothetical protein KKH94_01570 [Candidatus Omnitrophica bacterium]|nr:hypothetical protein [Candidatus Omnitrophota bacterium]
MNFRFFYSIAIIINLIISTPAAAFVETVEKGDEDSGRKVLIATDESQFKDAVVSQIVKLLETDACYIRVIDLKELRSEHDTNYHAIILMNSCWALQLNKHVKEFLDTVKYKERVILLTTAGNKNWKPKTISVDAITSASRIQEAASIAETVVDKVRERFL